jgi:hypothetical protein
VSVEQDNQQSARHSEISYVELDIPPSAQHSTCNNYQSILQVNVVLDNQQSARHSKISYVELVNQHSNVGLNVDCLADCLLPS